MIELTLSREATGLLGANMESYFQPAILRAGLRLYKDKKISHIWKDQFNIIHAIVGTIGSDHKLQIDLDFFLASECQCNERFCNHMAAVFFALFSRYGNPEDWIADVTAAPKTTNSDADSVMEGAHSRFAESSAQTSPDLNPANWETLLDKELNGLYRRHTDRFRIDIFYYTAFKKLSALAEDITMDEGKAFFRLYCAIKLLLHAEAHFASAGVDYPHAYYHNVISDLNEHFMERIRDSVLQIGNSHNEHTLPYCHTLIELLEKHIPLSGVPSFQWVDIHRLLWGQLLQTPSWLEAESLRINAHLAKLDSTSNSELTGQLSLMAAQLDWLLGRDEAAMSKLAQPHLNAGPLVISYLDIHMKTKSWSRLGRWLDFSLPLLRRSPMDAFNRALSIWQHYAKHTGNESSYRHALRSLLPRSYSTYTEYLMRTSQYEEWMNFHLLNAIPPGKIDRTQLKQLEQMQPALIIPIYHHAIERQLTMRNRAAYREAVKMLKRLKEAYTLMEEQERYQSYISMLTTRYQRLHAFVEELEKGKILG